MGTRHNEFGCGAKKLGEIEKGLVLNQPLIFIESQERRNPTLVKRRRRRRDFLPFIIYSISILVARLYGVPTPDLRQTYASVIFHKYTPPWTVTL